MEGIGVVCLDDVTERDRYLFRGKLVFYNASVVLTYPFSPVSQQPLLRRRSILARPPQVLHR